MSFGVAPSWCQQGHNSYADPVVLQQLLPVSKLLVAVLCKSVQSCAAHLANEVGSGSMRLRGECLVGKLGTRQDATSLEVEGVAGHLRDDQCCLCRF